MKFTPTDIRICSGGNHVFIDVTFGNGQTRTLQLLRTEFDLDPDEIQDAALWRIRSAVKESGATTNAARRIAIIGKEFQI